MPSELSLAWMARRTMMAVIPLLTLPRSIGASGRVGTE